jgi:hypothetical protein
MSGLLIGGLLFDVPGVTILSPLERPWVHLSSRDGRDRKTTWVRQATIHTTQGIWPQRILPGGPAQPGRRAQQVAEYWQHSSANGGAHLIVDGKLVACLADLLKIEAYHATKCNPWSYGLEMVQEPDGSIYEDTLNTTVEIVKVANDVLGIPLQISSRAYAPNSIIERLKHGGPDVVGVFGHRDNAWMFPEWLTPDKRKRYPDGYADRGRGDPGDEIYRRFRAAGAAMFDFDRGEELVYWRKVQKYLNQEHQAGLTEDGVCGPGTVDALRRAGLWNGGVFLEAPTP